MNPPIWYFKDGIFILDHYTLTSTDRYGEEVGELWELRTHGKLVATFNSLDEAMTTVRKTFLQ